MNPDQIINLETGNIIYGVHTYSPYNVYSIEIEVRSGSRVYTIDNENIDHLLQNWFFITASEANKVSHNLLAQRIISARKELQYLKDTEKALSLKIMMDEE